MSSAEDYQVQNVYRYSRKTYKKNRKCPQDNDDNIELVDMSPQSDARPMDAACSCDVVDAECDVASILHMKCPVISLAQHQLQRLLDGTDRLLCDNTRCCRSFNDFFWMCKDLLTSQDRCRCILLILIGIAFFIGMVLGAASCGTYLGRFNSPILECIDSFFIPASYPNIKESFRSIT